VVGKVQGCGLYPNMGPLEVELVAGQILEKHMATALMCIKLFSIISAKADKRCTGTHFY